MLISCGHDFCEGCLDRMMRCACQNSVKILQMTPPSLPRQQAKGDTAILTENDNNDSKISV
jgi:hypothetical protein